MCVGLLGVRCTVKDRSSDWRGSGAGSRAPDKSELAWWCSCSVWMSELQPCRLLSRRATFPGTLVESAAFPDTDSQIHAEPNRFITASTSYAWRLWAVQHGSRRAQSCLCSASGPHWQGVLCHSNVLAHRCVTADGCDSSVVIPKAHHLWVLIFRPQTSTSDRTLEMCHAPECVLDMTHGTSYRWHAVTSALTLCMTFDI